MSEYLVISTSIDLMRAASEDIVYVSSDGNYSSFVFTYGNPRVVTLQLGQVERLLAEQLTNSPLFEQATEQGGYFFRQYPSVANGAMVENRPENASFRRALCNFNGKLCIIGCTDRVLMNDFSQALAHLGVSDAILLVGGTADGWYRDAEGNICPIATSTARNAKYINYIVFRKQ